MPVAATVDEITNDLLFINNCLLINDKNICFAVDILLPLWRDCQTSKNPSMKAIGKRSVASVLKIMVNAVWYLQFAVFFGVLVLFVYIFTQKEYIGSDVSVKIQDYPKITGIASTSPNLQDTYLTLNAGMLHVEQRINWQLMVAMLAYFIGFAALRLLITHLLRKIFATLTTPQPFDPRNANRLRYIALLVMLFAPLELCNNVFMHTVVGNNFSREKVKFLLQLEINFQVIILGAVLLVIAEVFRVGTQLREENELTV